jgi:hypothetical protein
VFLLLLVQIDTDLNCPTLQARLPQRGLHADVGILITPLHFLASYQTERSKDVTSMQALLDDQSRHSLQFLNKSKVNKGFRKLFHRREAKQ